MHIKGTIKERNTLKRYPLKGNMNRSQVVSHDENRERNRVQTTHGLSVCEGQQQDRPEQKANMGETSRKNGKRKVLKKNGEGD